MSDTEDVSRLASAVITGGAQRTIAFVAVNLLSAGGMMLVLRHLGVAAFGRYGAVMALLAIVQGVSEAGMTLTGARDLSLTDSEADYSRLLGLLVGLRAVLVTAGVAAAVGIAIAIGYSRVMVWGTAIAGAGIVLLNVQYAMLLPLVVELQNWRLSVNDLLRQGVLVVCFVALSLTGSPLLGFFAAQLAAAIFVFAATPLLLRRRRLVRPRWTFVDLRRLAGRTLPVAVSSILFVLYCRVLVIVMSGLRPAADQLGYYVVATRITEAVLGLPIMLAGVILPALSVSARDDRGRLRLIGTRLSQTFGLAGTLLAIALILGAPTVLLVLGSRAALGGMLVLRIQAVSLVTAFVAYGWSATLIAAGHNRALVAPAVVGLLAAVGLGLLLIPPFAAAGAASAAALADVAYAGATYLALRRSGLQPVAGLGSLARLLVCAAPALLLGLLYRLPGPLDAVAGVSLFLIGCLWIGATPPELRAWISQRARADRIGRPAPRPLN